MYEPHLFKNSPVEEHLGWFQLLTVANKAAMNIHA
jgi:hypothetical protein